MDGKAGREAPKLSLDKSIVSLLNGQGKEFQQHTKGVKGEGTVGDQGVMVERHKGGHKDNAPFFPLRLENG